MLKRCSVTYSGCFVGYVVQNGIQVVLFETFERDKVEKLCSEFSCLYPEIYVEENFNIHKIYKFKL